jgi:hypothetical protein
MALYEMGHVEYQVARDDTQWRSLELAALNLQILLPQMSALVRRKVNSFVPGSINVQSCYANTAAGVAAVFSVI